MKVQIDPEWLRTSMTLWRQAVDMEIPIQDQLKLHFISQRKTLLEGFLKTAASWLMIFSSACKASDAASQEELDRLHSDINEFRSWAQKGLDDLQSLGTKG